MACARLHLSARSVGAGRSPAVSVRRPRVAAAPRRTLTVTRAAGEPGAGLPPDFVAAVDEFIGENKVCVFIKGTKMFPQCGFSNTVVQILNQMEVPYEAVNILEDDMLRSGMKEYSQWPTFPQVYIGGEFYGGCDILIEGFTDGTLKEELERIMLE